MNEQVKNNIMEYKQKYLQKLTDAQVPEKLEKQLEEMDWSCLELNSSEKTAKRNVCTAAGDRTFRNPKEGRSVSERLHLRGGFQAWPCFYIDFYNIQRPHRTLKNLTPCQVEDAFIE